MHKNPDISFNNSKTLQNLQYKVEKKDKIPYWDSIHKKRKVSKGFHPSHVNEVKWFKGCPDIWVE
jgi:hypothetical protein